MTARRWLTTAKAADHGGPPRPVAVRPLLERDSYGDATASASRSALLGSLLSRLPLGFRVREVFLAASSSASSSIPAGSSASSLASPINAGPSVRLSPLASSDRLLEPLRWGVASAVR